MAVQINVQANQTALAQSIAQGVAQFNSRLAGQNQLNLQINSKSFSQPLGRITSDLADFESAMKASNARVLAFGASTAVLGGVIKAFKEIADSTVEVEKSLTDINRVLNLSISGLQKFSSELFDISRKTAVSFQDASKAALEFSRQGLSTEETLKRTKDALILVRLTGVDSAKAVEDLTAAVNGFSKEGLNTASILNKIVAVEQRFAVSAKDLTEALSRTGQAAQEAGVDFNELNALVATAQQTTARGGAVIGNALKTIFTRLQRSTTLDQLEQFNIQVRDFQGNILPATQILKNFSAAYQGLADSQRAYLSEQVAGVYQVNILKSLIADLNNQQGTYNKALQIGLSATNEATMANEELNKTLSALISQTTTGLQQLGSNIGKVTFEPIFRAIVSPINDAVSYINETLEGEGIGSIFANGLLKGIRNVIAGPALITIFAVIEKIAKNTFVDLTKALPAVLGITTQAQKRANIEQSILQILQSQGKVSQALQGLQGNGAAQAQLLLQLARAQTSEYEQQLKIAQQLASTLATKGVTVGARGLQTGPRIKAAGHIPSNLASAEKMGAMMGGYMPGKVVPSPVGGVMNTAEQVKYIPGFAQPFINPPLNSRAGKAHRAKAIGRTGVDPYMYDGFVPNFVKVSQLAKDFPSTVGFKFRLSKNTNNFLGESDSVNLIGDKFTKYFMPKRKGESATGYEKRALDAFGYKSSINLYNKSGSAIDGYKGPFNFLEAKSGKFLESDVKFKFLRVLMENYGEKNDLDKWTAGKDLFRVSGLLVHSDERELEKFKNKTTFFTKSDKSAFQKDRAAVDTLRASKYKRERKFTNKGFIPNFAKFAGAGVIRRLLESGTIENYRVPGTKLYQFPDGSSASVSQVEDVAARVPKGKDGKPGKIKFAGGTDFSAIELFTGKNQLIDLAYEAEVQKAIPGLISAHGNEINFSLPFTGGPNSYIDFFNPATKTFYEAKGGKWSPSEVSKKFRDVRDDLGNQLNKQLQEWKNVLVYNPDFAASGFIPNFARFKSKFGTATLGKTDPIDLEYFSKTLGRKIKTSDIVSIEDLTTKGKGSAGGLYGDIASSIKGKGGIFGYALAQDRAVKGNDPLARLKAKYPQIAKRIGLGGETFISGDYGQTVVRASTIQDLVKYQDQILRMVDPAVLTLKSFAGGFIPNFAYKNAVMQLEEGLSGNKAIFDTKPFPHIRNSSQPTFASAIRDHGGLNNAISDSYKNQKAAGLMSRGFVPNFADFDPTGINLRKTGGQFVNRQQITNAINNYVKSTDLLTKNNFVINNEIQKLLGQYQLNKTSFADLRTAVMKHVDAERVAAQAAQQSAQASQQNTQAQQQATRAVRSKSLAESFGGLFGRRGAARGRLLERRFGGLGSNIGLQIAGPMIGGVLESVISGNAQREDMSYGRRFAAGAASSAFTGVTTGAMLGSVIPGIGTAAGAVIGGLSGLAMAALKARDSLEDLQKASAKRVKESQEQEQAVQRFIDMQAQLESPQNLTQEQTKKLFIERQRAYENLPDDIRKNLQITSSVTEVQKKLAEVENNTYKQQLRASVVKLMDVKKLSEAEKKNAVLDLARLAKEEKNLDTVLAQIEKIESPEQILNIFSSEAFKGLDEEFKAILKSSFKSEFVMSGQTAFGPVVRSFFSPLIETLKSQKGIIKDAEKQAKDAAESVGPSASQLFAQINNYLNNASNIIQQEIAEAGYMKIIDAAADFNDSLVEAFTDSIHLINTQTQRRQEILKRNFALQIKEADVSFQKSFSQAFESSQFKSPATAGALKFLLEEGASPDELENFITGLTGGTDEQRRNLLQLIADQKALQERRGLENNIESENINEQGRQLQVRARLAQEDNKNRVLESSAIAQRQKLLDDEAARIDVKQFERDLSLQDPSVFYGKSIAEEAEMRIKMRELTQKENLDLQKKTALTGAQNILNEKSLEIQNRINAATESGRNDDADRLRDLQKNYKLQIDNLQSLDEAIKKQKEIAEKEKEGSDEQLRAVATLEQLNRLRDDYNRQLETANQKMRKQTEFERKQAARQISFRAGFEDAFQNIYRETETFNYTFGQKIPTLFRDGLVGAMDAAINKTDDLGNALLEVAASFLRSIQSALLQQAANVVVSGIGQAFPKQKGGVIRAQNGMYISGGRTGDKNPALLEDGEYVLNRNAVKAMGGPRALDTLNFAAFPRFANGGRTSSGERILTPDVPLNALVSSRGANASSSVNLGAYSDRLSGYALENTIFIKEYFDQQRQLQEEAQRRREQRRALIRQIAVSALSSAALGAVGYGFQAYKNRAPLKGGIDANPSTYGKYANMAQTGGLMKFNSGGYLPYGNRLTDSIPALLTGGEYIINSRAVRKYGVGGLNRINNGVARFENGGMVDVGMSGSSNSQTSTSATNNISVNITVNNTTGKSKETESASGGESKSENEKYSEFSKRVKEAVVQVIVQEQRSGGLLDATKKRTQ